MDIGIALTVAMPILIVLTYKFDRAILVPQIEKLIVIAEDSHSTLDVLVAIRNSGHQGSSSDLRSLVLTLGGTRIEGKELYGQPVPPHSEIAPNLSEQDFPPTKPIRGWAFYSLDGIASDFLKRNLTCASPLLQKAEIAFTIRDSKMGREWSSRKTLSDMGSDGCIVVQDAGTPAPPKTPPSSAHQENAGSTTKQSVKVQGNNNNAGTIDQTKSANSNAAVGNDNFQNSGTISPTVAPCGIAQIGNNNVASVSCAPPSGAELAKYASGMAIQIVSGAGDPKSVPVPIATGFWVSDKGYIATCLHSVRSGYGFQAEVPIPPLLGTMMTVAAGAMTTALVPIFSDEDSDIAIMHVEGSPFERSLHQMAVAQKLDDKNKPTGQPEVTEERYWVPAIANVLPKDGDEIIRVGFNREHGLPLSFYDFGHITRMGVNPNSAKAQYQILTSFLSVKDSDCGAPVLNNAKTVVGMMHGSNGEAIPSTYIVKVLERAH